jgi:hypothetical protein
VGDPQYAFYVLSDTVMSLHTFRNKIFSDLVCSPSVFARYLLFHTFLFIYVYYILNFYFQTYHFSSSSSSSGHEARPVNHLLRPNSCISLAVVNNGPGLLLFILLLRKIGQQMN